MNEKGRLEIRVDHRQLTAQDIPAQYNCAPGDYACLCVQDSGCGMDAETMKKIFDPFFTTKGIGEGTGMGLSTVHGIVNQHNGMIKVESQPGQGATFALYFPRVAACEDKAETDEIANLPHGSEHLLFVDDEPLIRAMWEQLLQELGYRITAVENGHVALTLFKASPEDFDLVITDQTMPELSGRDLISELQQLRPGIPSILCTGYSNKITAEDAHLQGIDAFCMKPLDLATLARTIRQVLDADEPTEHCPGD